VAQPSYCNKTCDDDTLAKANRSYGFVDPKKMSTHRSVHFFTVLPIRVELSGHYCPLSVQKPMGGLHGSTNDRPVGVMRLEGGTRQSAVAAA